MKVRIPAVISILALAAWLPIQAQQAAAPNAPATQTTAAPDGKSKDAAGCCRGKDAATSCCAVKEAKDMAACCGQKDAAGKTAMNCCEGKKDTMCAAKDGKTCSSDMNAKDGKGCCASMKDHCAAHANGK